MMETAPIALFAFRRPEHTRRTLEALARNPLAAESALYVFCDGPRNAADEEGVAAVRRIVREAKGFGAVEIFEQASNRGLANSVISGVTKLCCSHGRVIVLEDDLVVSPSFLDYMNTALDRYKDDGRVMQVSGYMFPVRVPARTDAIFLPLTTSWGWATWYRAWRHFDPEAQGSERLLNDIQLREAFNVGGAYDYSGMLQRQMEGRESSWAIRWYWSVFLQRGLVLYPLRSLVINEGFDSSGTHGAAGKTLQVRAVDLEFVVKTYPEVDRPTSSLDLIKPALSGGRPGLKERLRRLMNGIARATQRTH